MNHALIRLEESFTNTLEDNCFGCGIFQLPSSVKYQGLLNKLEHYSILGTALAWLSSYLSNKKQYVSVNGHN